MKKFDSKSHEGNFLGYSATSKAYRVYLKTTLVVDESMHIVFYEYNVLLEISEDCIGHSIERDVSFNEESDKGILS